MKHISWKFHYQRGGFLFVFTSTIHLYSNKNILFTILYDPFSVVDFSNIIQLLEVSLFHTVTICIGN